MRNISDKSVVEQLKSLGADYVIDYTNQDFTENGQQYDVVIDTVGKISFFRCRKVLKKRDLHFIRIR